MRKITIEILVLFFSIFCSCKKDSIDPFIVELEQFKNQTGIQFSGQVIDYDVNWNFRNWQNGIGNYSESYWCLTDSKKIQQRNFSIYDYEYRDFIVSLKVNSPAFSIDSSYSYKKSIFNEGKKIFHLNTSSIFDGFEIIACTKEELYSSAFGEQKSSTFEIIKVQEITNSDLNLKDYKKLKLWIVVSCNLYENGGRKVGSINKGKFIGEIEIERNE